jgi:hypothetical protein
MAENCVHNTDTWKKYRNSGYRSARVFKASKEGFLFIDRQEPTPRAGWPDWAIFCPLANCSHRAVFLENQRSNRNLFGSFSMEKWCIKFDKNRGFCYILGDFFHHFIWSPCPRAHWNREPLISPNKANEPIFFSSARDRTFSRVAQLIWPIENSIQETHYF